MEIPEIKQEISSYPFVRDRMDEHFYEDMEAWITHGANTVVQETNQLRIEQNLASKAINENILSLNLQEERIANDLSDYNTTLREVQDDINAKENKIKEKYEEIQSYTIPMEATYKKQKIDEIKEDLEAEMFLGLDY